MRLRFVFVLIALLAAPAPASAESHIRPSGQAQACQAHLANSGRSYAKGLHCITPTLTVVVQVFSGVPGTNFKCSATITGTGLLPGSSVGSLVVQPDGTLSFTGTFDYQYGIRPDTVISATTVYGDTITVAFQPKCSVGRSLTYIGQVIPA